jgi:hypothetical protein
MSPKRLSTLSIIQVAGVAAIDAASRRDPGEQARYETAKARRQYDAVDPDNRLAASELERRWNAALAAVDVLERELATLVRPRPATLGAEERQRLLQMGADLEAAWHHPAATAVTRKRLIRAVMREVVARVEDDQIQLLLHWQGGDHSRKNRRGQTRWAVEPETMDIRSCARLMPDKAIAGMLNRTGKRTGPAERMDAVACTWLPQTRTELRSSWTASGPRVAKSH